MQTNFTTSPIRCEAIPGARDRTGPSPLPTPGTTGWPLPVRLQALRFMESELPLRPRGQGVERDRTEGARIRFIQQMETWLWEASRTTPIGRRPWEATCGQQ